MTKKTKTKTSKTASDASVLARAKRLARAELKSAALALGLESFEEAAFRQKIAELKTSRESGLGDGEKKDLRIKELEAQLAQHRRAAFEAKAAEAKLQKRIRQAEAERARVSVEQRIAEAARGVGVRDPNYATHLFREHVLSDGAHKQDPSAFFESLKKDAEKAHLFETKTVGAHTQSKLRVAEAPQKIEKQAPEPKTVSVQAEQPEDVSELSANEFQKRTREKYGFRPTMLGA